jgi:hypothetical protein
MAGVTPKRTSAPAATEITEATEFLRRFFRETARQRSRLVPKAPLGAIQTTARHSDDPFLRRQCLFFLDHYANDASMATFADALGDPVDFVRNSALHSLACESCKAGPLGVADVLPAVVSVLERDPSPDLRAKCLPVLVRLARADLSAREVLERAARADPDELVRRAATDALAGRFVAPRKRCQRRQRRHAAH